MSVVLVSASPNASEEVLQEVFEKHGLEREAPAEKKEEPETVVVEAPTEPDRGDFASDEEFDAAHGEWKEAGEKAAAAKEGDDGEPRKLSRVQRKVQRETAKLRDENDDLRRRLEALEKAKGTQPEVKEKEPAAEKNPRPKRDDFKTAEEYEDELIKWGTKKERAEEEAAAKDKSEKDTAEAQQKQLEANFENYREQVEEFKDTHSDWKDVVDRKDIFMHTAVQLALFEIPNGAEVTYYLGKHPDFAEELAEMSPLSAVAEIGVLSRKLQSEAGRKPSGPATAWGGEPRTQTRPKAPAPVQPVRTGTTLSSMTSRDAAKAGNFKAFKRLQRQGK